MMPSEIAAYHELRTAGLTRDDAAEKVGYTVRQLGKVYLDALRYGKGAVRGGAGHAHKNNCRRYGISRPEEIPKLIGAQP